MNQGSRVVRLEWEGPFGLVDVEGLTGNSDYGVYQVYGRHPVFGTAALLYIGSATARSFGARIREHREWLQYVDGLELRLGRIADDDYNNNTDWAKLVLNVEALTIYWHGVPYNSKNIQSYNGPALHVQNWGRPGSLLPEYSSDWKPIRPDDELGEA